MQVIKLTHNDLNEMIHRAVRSLMNESVDETQSSISSSREEVIDEIFEFIKKSWQDIQDRGIKPVDSYDASMRIEIPEVPNAKVTIVEYKPIAVPLDLTEKLNIAEQFGLYIAFRNHIVSDEVLKVFTPLERSTGGSSLGGGVFDQFSKSKMKVAAGLIILNCSAINGELQGEGIYATLYHEFNHNLSNLQIKLNKMNDYEDPELSKMNISAMSQRADDSPHDMVQGEQNPDVVKTLFRRMTMGPYYEDFQNMNHIFYAIWEQAERNARAEEIYGVLKHANPKSRADLKAIWPQTGLYAQIKQIEDFLKSIELVPVDDQNGKAVWAYSAKVMNMKPRGRGKNGFNSKFLLEVKERFLKRTHQLLDDLYKKAMRAAEYYFNKREDKNQDPNNIHVKINNRAKKKSEESK